MVALCKIELGEKLGAPCLVEQGVNVGQRFDLGLGDGVEPPVVVADPPGSVGFTHEHHRCGVTRRRGLDPTPVE